MKITRKETYCPLCFGELVIEDGKVTCIEGHDLSEVEFEPETMAKLQPVIDWQKEQATVQGGRTQGE